MFDWMDIAGVAAVAATGAAAFLYRSALRRQFATRRPTFYPTLAFLADLCILFCIYAALKPKYAAPLALIVAVAFLVGAVLGALATPRKVSPWWVVAAAPVAAGLITSVGFAVGDRLCRHPLVGRLDWGTLLPEVSVLAVGVTLWGAVPAAVAALAFQTHRWSAAPRRGGEIGAG